MLFRRCEGGSLYLGGNRDGGCKPPLHTNNQCSALFALFSSVLYLCVKIKERDRLGRCFVRAGRHPKTPGPGAVSCGSARECQCQDHAWGAGVCHFPLPRRLQTAAPQMFSVPMLHTCLRVSVPLRLCVNLFSAPSLHRSLLNTYGLPCFAGCFDDKRHREG